MANARMIVKRRKAVTNIKKITRTMQLIATAKFQKALNRATATQPYTKKLTEMVSQLSAQVSDIEHPLLKVNTTSQRVGFLALTSNRGLCGGHNARVIQASLEQIKQLEQDRSLDLDVVGKKGISYFNFIGRSVATSYTEFEDLIRFSDVEAIANGYIDAYARGQVDAVHVGYMQFVSAARQVPTVVQLLPIQQLEDGGGSADGGGVQYDFSPEPEALLAELLPATVRMRLYQCFMDSLVSEQIARMVAMKAATDAASDMIKYLTRTYNRARQSQITMELLDIMGGVEAIS